MTTPVRIDAEVPIDRLDPAERRRVREAALHATRLYPGPVGELVSRELVAWQEFGYRFDRSSLATRLVEDILATALPSVAE